MALYPIEAQRLDFKKEAVRGTAETTPTKWYPVLKGTELKYDLALLENDVLKGDPAVVMPAYRRGKDGAGRLNYP